MVRAVRTLAVSRIAAVAVALALSGGLRLVAAAAPRPGHRCTCPAAGLRHACECPICQRRVAGAPAARPPCHGEARASPAPEGARRPERTAACLGSACGAADGAVASADDPEAFTLPAPSGGAARAAAGPLLDVTPPVASPPPSPDPPPPRAA